jgi:hypothetical protein
VTGGNTFDSSADSWSWALVYWFVKRQQKRLKKKRLQNTDRKSNHLLNTLEQKELWQKEK